LHLDESARVTGSVEAEAVVVAGQLDGDAKARASVAILASGRIRGTVTAPAVSLEEGGGLDGRIEAEVELPEAIA
jgi:cytoskeletal protein CcmA (bactofilin family)